MQILKLSDNVVYQHVNSELLVIDIDPGILYYFSAETKGILDYFKEPRTLESLLEGWEAEGMADAIERLCNDLVERNILIPISENPSTVPKRKPKLRQTPKFLRVGEKKLDDLLPIHFTTGPV